MPRTLGWVVLGFVLTAGAFGGAVEPPPAVVLPPTVLRQWSSDEQIGDAVDRQCVERARQYAFRRDLREAARLGVLSLAEHQNWDRCRRPPLSDPNNRETTSRVPGSFPEMYWSADCLADGTGRFGPEARKHALDTGVAHVLGRSLWAMLRAEEVMGDPAPAEALAVLREYLRAAYDNPDHLAAFFNPDDGYRRAYILHDQREGLLGLLALLRVRHDAWAAEEFPQVVAALEKCTDEQGHLSPEVAKANGLQAPILGAGNDATTCGRYVEPLVEYYQFTHDTRALQLAERYALATLATTFDADGHFREESSSGGHIHSITSSLCGIVRYALVAENRPLLDQARRVLDVGVPEYASSWGWVDELMPKHEVNEIGRGEVNQVGDVIRCGLLLGEAGYPEYYELAERFLRSTLLPVQHRAEELGRFMKPVASPQADWQRDVPARVVGGYAMFLPNDRMRPGVWPLTSQDIISGGVHGLCEAWCHRVTATPEAIRVNLLLDCEGPELSVTSSLPLVGRLRLQAKSVKPVLVRVPGWVDASAMRLTVEGKPRPATVADGYVRIEMGRSGAEALLEFPLPCKVQQEMVDGTQYTSTWLGSQVIEILPRGTVSPLPF